jgi:hypothetical protein
MRFALKRVFRYLNGTIGHGLTFQVCESEPYVYCYSDADWAGDVETRRSTSGHAFLSWKEASFLGNLVSSLLSLFPQQKPSMRLSPRLFAKPRGSEACLPRLALPR